MTHVRWPLPLLLLAAVLASSPLYAETPYFAALFADGTYIADGRLADWHDDTAQPKFGGRLLFDPQRPVVFLRNASVAADARPSAYVEMFGGDRLVGEVTGFAAGEQSFYRRDAEALIVAPAVDIAMPESPRPSAVHVLARWAKRIVWQPRYDTRYTPATLYYRDGRELAFRRVRFGPRGVLLLVDSGLVDVPLGEIAELHMPRSDPWQVYFEQLALLGDAEARLVRLETDEGLCLTTSTARFRSRHWGDAADPNNWFRVVQPAWCREPLVVPQRRVHTMRWTAAHEVPLSALEPTAIEEKPLIAGGWTARIDRNVREAPLSTGGRESAWGIGMHGNSRMTFPLHDSATSFRSAVGLDRSVGRGGCARAEVHLDAGGSRRLFRSGHLIGSRNRVDTGVLALAAAPGKPRQLVLHSDAAHDDRPADADPFDIRDHVDWCEPTLVLDPAKLKAAVAAAAASLVPAWDGWDVAVEGDALPLADRFEERQANGRRFVCDVAGNHVLTLKRSLRVASDHRFLMLCVEQTQTEGDANKIAVHVDGKPYAALDIPRAAWNGDAPTPRLIAVDDLRGRDATFEIVQTAASAKNRVAWRRIALVAEPTNTKWTVLAPVAARSTEGVQFNSLPDGSLLVSGRAVDRDRYTIDVETKLRGITAIRVETLLDETLPRGGPGRAGDGRFQLTEAKISARGIGAAESEAQDVSIAAATADYHESRFDPGNAIDGQDNTGWNPGVGTLKPHAIVISLAADPSFADGTRLAIVLDQQAGGRQTLGRFRISATTDTLPQEAEQLGRRIATLAEQASDAPPRRRILFDDEPKFIESFSATDGKLTRATGDRFTGGACMQLSRGSAENTTVADLHAKIRPNPGPGEYRYLRFAWRKRGGGSAVLQLADNGAWRSMAAGVDRELTYVGGNADADANAYAGAIVVARQLPDDWTVVTRDLYADFGPIALTGFRLRCPDGDQVLLDSVQLARSLDDFERPAP